eukprot:3823795-Rhodomonas_salina.1
MHVSKATFHNSNSTPHLSMTARVAVMLRRDVSSVRLSNVRPVWLRAPLRPAAPPPWIGCRAARTALALPSALPLPLPIPARPAGITYLSTACGIPNTGGYSRDVTSPPDPEPAASSAWSQHPQ